MRVLKLIALYAGLALMGNPAAAEDYSAGRLIALASGDLARLQVHAAPEALPATGFVDANGAAKDLGAYRGKHVLLNFWALWCAPCVKEMPALERLDAALGGPKFEVVTVATGRNNPDAVDVFFKDKGLTHLPKYFDPRMQMARELGALGLPVSVLIDPEGREVARLMGDLEWDSAEAQAFIRGWIGE